MEPIYDRSGAVVAWLDGGTIYDRSGQPRAFAKRDAVFTFSSRYVGRYQKGFFRDRWRNAVAFTEGAAGGPPLPLKHLTPQRPLKGLKPLPPVTPVPPVAPIATFNWSTLQWQQYLR